MRSKLLISAAFIFLMSCNGGDKPQEEQQPEQDLYVEGQIDAFRLLLEMQAVIDPNTLTLRENLPDDLRFKDYFKEFEGKKLCPCDTHSTGQAHTHQKNMNLASEKKMIMGWLKIYNKTIDTLGNEGYEPCYFPFINTTRVTLEDCQHIADQEGNPAYKNACVGNVMVAYDLDPVSSGDHTNVEDCHPGSADHAH